MKEIDVIDQIRTHGQLPSLPGVFSELLEESSKDDFSPSRLCEIISKDPSLTASLLRHANSPFYAIRGKVSTINQAITILGITTVKCNALASSIMRADAISAKSGVDIRELFASILTIANLAKRLSESSNPDLPDQVFVAGLLSDIGRIYLLKNHPNEYRRVIKMNSEGTPLPMAEAQIFGADHCRIGGLLCQFWNLPLPITEAVKHHHSNDNFESLGEIAQLIALASHLTPSDSVEYRVSHSEKPALIGRLVSSLKINREKMSGMVATALSESVKMAESLGIDIGSNETLLTRANQEIWKSYETIEILHRERTELTRRLLQKERQDATRSARQEALATLSHYINNALMAIIGRNQLLRDFALDADRKDLVEEAKSTVEITEVAVMKISAVIQEMKALADSHDIKYLNESQAIDLDEKIRKRVQLMNEEPDVIVRPGSKIRLPNAKSSTGKVPAVAATK